MELRRLGQTEIRISPLGLGCWQLSRGQGAVGRYWPVLGREAEREIVRAALEGGMNWFDTAELYGWGESERALSEALRALGRGPESVVIATKWWPLFRSAGHIRKSVPDRLAALDGLRIDLHQVHCRGSLSSIAAQMNAMADLVEEGKIRSIGVSNFGTKAMQAAHRALQKRGIPLASNQVHYSLLDRRIEKNGVMAAAKDLGITLIAYSPLETGLLSGKFHADPGRVSGPRRRLRQFRAPSLARTRPLIGALTAVGEAHGATPAQVALRWITCFNGETVVAIPGATRPEQARGNSESMKLALSEAEMDTIDRASRQIVA